MSDPAALSLITVVGIGDDGPASLLPGEMAIVKAAEVLCGGERHLAFFRDHPGERLVIKRDVASLIDRLSRETRPTVVLASGDPCCFGIGPLLAKKLGNRVCIIPSVSSVQLAFARLGESWQDAAILSAHGRALDAIMPAALLARKAAIFTDATNTPSEIANALLAAGDTDTSVDVFEHLGGPNERHTSTTLHDTASREFSPLNVTVLRRSGAPRPWPLGLPEDAYVHRAGLITKAEVRAVSLSKLGLHEQATLWDVGAGCGSVSIEAATLLAHGSVYAVERDAEQRTCLAANRLRFGAGNVHIVEGEAPSVLAGLPDPDRVFIGGSGERLAPILDAIAPRLRPGGRIVANFVSLEHVAQAMGWAREHRWPADITQISAARSTDTAGLVRLEALNPVFIATLLPSDTTGPSIPLRENWTARGGEG